MTGVQMYFLVFGLCIAFVSESSGIQPNSDVAQGVAEIKVLGGKAAVEERGGGR